MPAPPGSPPPCARHWRSASRSTQCRCPPAGAGEWASVCPLQGEGKKGVQPWWGEGRGWSWEHHPPNPTGECRTHPNAPTRQHGVHLLADGACKEEGQSYVRRRRHCQGRRWACAVGRELSHRERADPSREQATAAHARKRQPSPVLRGDPSPGAGGGEKGA